MKKLFTIICGAMLVSLAGLSAQTAEETPICPPPACDPCCSALTYEIEATYLCLQPTASNMHYAAEAFPLPLPSPNWQISDIKPDYDSGFDVSFSLYGQDATKFKFNYTYFHSKHTSSTTAGTNDMIGPFFEIGPDAAPYTFAKGRVSFDFDAMDVEYGLRVDFGDNLRTNFFAGVAGARIKQGLTSTYSNSDGTIARTIKTPSSFLGAGPELGVDFSYNVYNGFKLTGGALTALLVGKLKNNTKYASISPALAPLGIIPPNDQETHVHDRTAVVPVFKSKLGVAYGFDLCNCPINVDVGYEVRLFINAIQSVDIGSEVITPPVTPDTVGVFARTFQRNLSNFALAGPYFKIGVGF